MPVLPEFERVFNQLKIILQKHVGNYSIKPDTPFSFGIQGKPGPATLKVWGGKMKKPVMPVAWIEIGKAYVSFHVMGLYTNTALQSNVKGIKNPNARKDLFQF